MEIHLTDPEHERMNAGPALYTIRVGGHLGPTVLSAFPGLVARRRAAQTVLTGFLDRAALYGVLAQLELLGLELVEVRQVEPAGPEPRDGGCQVD